MVHEFSRALGADTCGAVAGNGVVPTRILVEGVEGVYVFAKSLARLGGRSQRVVKINILAPIISAQTNAIALIRHDVNERVLPIKTFQSGVTAVQSSCVFRWKSKAEAHRQIES